MEDIKFSELANFQPKQLQAQEALNDYKYLLYGGAAGGGKSYWLRWMGVRLLMYYFAKYNLKGVRGGLFCEDYPALRERHLSKIPYEFPDWLGTLNKSEHEFRLNPEFGSGVLAFRNLDDPSKYLSSEFAFVEVDELTKNKRETFDFLNLRMRWPGIPDTKFLAATNPGEIGHGWVKKLWVSRDFEGENFKEEDFTFVQSFYKDNKYIDPSYEEQLDSLPDQLRRAYKEGDWDIFAGQFFTEFRRSVHVIDPFLIPNHWEKIICMDYGFTNPSCVLWIAYDKDFDTYYVYSEIYGTNHTYKELARLIRERNGELNQVDLNRTDASAPFCYADPAIWAKKDSINTGADEIMKEYKGLKLFKANNDRVNGALLLRKLLNIDNAGNTKIKIFNNCVNLIRTLPELVHDKNKVEDVDTKGEDHAYDALRYGVMSFLKKTSGSSQNKVTRSYVDPIERIHQRMSYVDPMKRI